MIDVLAALDRCVDQLVQVVDLNAAGLLQREYLLVLRQDRRRDHRQTADRLLLVVRVGERFAVDQSGRTGADDVLDRNAGVDDRQGGRINTGRKVAAVRL